MRTRYLGILAFTLLTGVIFVLAFHFLGAWGAVLDRRTAVMVLATFALGTAILLFRILTAGRDWDPPADTAFTAAALVLMTLLLPWGSWLLVLAIPIGGFVTLFKLVRVAQTRAPMGELAYSMALFVEFVLILATLPLLWIQ